MTKLFYATPILLLFSFALFSHADEVPFYIGTYTNGESQGIYRSALNVATGELSQPHLVAELKNPSFLAIHPTERVLYAISEVASDGEAPQVFSFNIGANQDLKKSAALPAGGDGPCYVSIDRSGRFVLVANYGSGSVSSFATDAEGTLTTMVSRHQHVGSSINQRRQQGPHAHSIIASPTNAYVCAADLGMDQIVVYRFDEMSGELKPAGDVALEPGSGPRHLAFHPAGKHLVAIEELSVRLTSFLWQDGKATKIQSHTTLPENYESTNNSTAEVLFHPSGKFLYGSNRGHNSIAVFRFDADSGKMRSIQHVDTGGKTPRNFRIDPTGRWLLAENQNSNSIHVYKINVKNGKLRPTEHSIKVGSPVCIKFDAQ